MQLYSGAKAYGERWSEALHMEMKAENIDIEVLHILTGMVATPREQPHRKPSLVTPSPRRFASTTLNKVGCGRSQVAGYWVHEAQFGPMMALPDWLKYKIMINIIKGEVVKEKDKKRD
jgi:short-subunit dehydrogenase